MAKIAPLTLPLTAAQAANTLAHRLGKVANNIRPIATRLGARPYRVWLVWSRWTGSKRGEGTEQEIMRTEILPTPMVETLDGIALSPQNMGLVQVGDVRVTEINLVDLTEETLLGRTNGAVQVEQPFAFYWEIAEDGRGGGTPVRSKFRVRGRPTRRADMADWLVNLERISDDRTRSGSPQGEPK